MEHVSSTGKRHNATATPGFMGLAVNSQVDKPLASVTDVSSDINECADKPCHWMAHCTNTFGSYSCSCFPGFAGDGVNCADIDECELGKAACPENSRCVNLPGSYLCNCTEGYMPKGSPVEKCVGKCNALGHPISVLSRAFRYRRVRSRTLRVRGRNDVSKHRECTPSLRLT